MLPTYVSQDGWYRASLTEPHTPEVRWCPQHYSNLKPLGCALSNVHSSDSYKCLCTYFTTVMHYACPVMECAVNENEGSAHMSVHVWLFCTLRLTDTATLLVVCKHVSIATFSLQNPMLQCTPAQIYSTDPIFLYTYASSR